MFCILLSFGTRTSRVSYLKDKLSRLQALHSGFLFVKVALKSETEQDESLMKEKYSYVKGRL